ncbi:MAG: thiamine pyrophosphate-binding protein [Janthinobacterium lividum]
MADIHPEICLDAVRLTGAEAVLRVLRAAYVKEVFGLASGKLSPLFRALANDNGFLFTGVRHEASAAFMATSVYAGTGRLAVCLGETGPGGLNLMGGLGGAWANNLAVLAITSSNPMSMMAPARGAFSSTNNEKVFAPVTKWNATVRDPSRIPELLRQSIRAATSGRPGPVHLDIPTDVLGASCVYSASELDASPSSYISSPPVADAGDINRAAELLATAKNPLIIAGGGVVRSGASVEVQRLLDRLNCPGMTTQMGLGAIPSDHPCFIGQGGFVGGSAVVRAIREADVVIAIGCRFSSFMWVDGPPKWTDAPQRKLIQIDIDPQAFGANVPIAIGLQGDARRTVEALNDALEQKAPACDLRWLEALVRERASFNQGISTDNIGGLLHPAALAKGVASFIKPDDLVTFDGGHTTFWSNEYTAALLPATRFHEPGMSHLGFGLPAAIGLAVTRPDRRAFCITGDGSFGFSLQELDTARRYGVNVVTIVHNNGAWGVIRAAQKMRDFELGTDLSGTDYAAIARGFGCHGEVVERSDQIDGAMIRALDAGKPAVIDARVAWVPHPMFKTFGGSTSSRT